MEIIKSKVLFKKINEVITIQNRLLKTTDQTEERLLTIDRRKLIRFIDDFFGISGNIYKKCIRIEIEEGQYDVKRGLNKGKLSRVVDMSYDPEYSMSKIETTITNIETMFNLDL